MKQRSAIVIGTGIAGIGEGYCAGEESAAGWPL
jgi:hypothetical protein